MIRRIINSLWRYTIWHYASKSGNYILVSEFPKSGGTWLCQMIGDLSNIPFPRKSFPRYSNNIMHGHYPYKKTFTKPIFVMRDGRDVMVSAYFHFLFENDHKPKGLTAKWLSLMPFTDIEQVEKNLPAFLTVFNQEFSVAGEPLTWSGHIQSFIDLPEILTVKYEDLLMDCSNQLERVCEYLQIPQPNAQQLQATIEKFSFQQLSGRLPGTNLDSHFLRKGIAGDWKNYFTQASSSLFDKLYGDTLIKAGYETDRKWISRSK